MLADGTIDRIVIDDIRTLANPALHFRSAHDAFDFILDFTGTVNELWLDYDMGKEEEFWVLTLARWLDKMGREGDGSLRIGTVFIHTQNPVGAERLRVEIGPAWNVQRVGLESFLPAV